jgi:hypothetical protein
VVGFAHKIPVAYSFAATPMRSSSPPDLVRPAAHESLFYTSLLDWIFLLNFLLSAVAGSVGIRDHPNPALSANAPTAMAAPVARLQLRLS